MQDFSPISSRTWGHSELAIQVPLSQAIGVDSMLVFVHVPFTASDLLNWKLSVGPYGEDPEGIY